MARTKAEIRAFLDGQVGKIAPHPGYPSLNGQCVTLTKALMEFLGVPSPYAARGNAIDAGDTYIRQGLGTAGKGWLTIVVNRDMGFIGGVHYGHIWIDLQNEANYEANGARALYTTKNTRPISQGQQFINFDKWVTDGGDMPELVTEDTSNIIEHGVIARNGIRGRAYSLDGSTGPAWVGAPLTNKLIQDIFLSPEARDWRDSDSPSSIKDINRKLDRLPVAEAQLSNTAIQLGEVTKASEAKDAVITAQAKEIESLKAQTGDNSKWETLKALLRELFGTGGAK